MLTYEEFKNEVKEKLPDYMPEEFSEHKVVFRETLKINHKSEGLELVLHGEHSDISASFMDMNDMYSDYLSSRNMERTLSRMAIQICSGYKEIDKSEMLKLGSMGREEFLQNVIMVLINTEQNSELLKRSPHREFLDLSVIYQIPLNAKAEYYGMARVTNEWVEGLNISEDELFKMAKINVGMMYPPTFNSMKSVIMEMTKDLDIMPPRMEDGLEEKEMFVIKNDANIYGANGMLYENMLHGIASILNSNIYILPSSLHELIVVRENSVDLEHLQEMVRTINDNELSPKDKLSDNVYHYDKSLRKVTIAAEVPVKEAERDVMEKKENKSRMEGETKPWKRTMRL